MTLPGALSGAAEGGRRWHAPAAVLALELSALSLLLEFPTSGTAVELAAFARLLLPVLIAAGAVHLVIARDPARTPALAGEAPWPSRRGPLVALAVQLCAFAATAAFGWTLMRPGAPPLDRLPFAAWLAGAALTAALAGTIAYPPRALLRLAARRAAAPLVSVAAGLVAWRAINAANSLWGSLSDATLYGAAAVLRAVSADVFVEPAGRVIGVDDFSVEIAPVCSGVDGLGLILVFQALWLSLARHRLRAGRAALVLVPLGAVAALAANVLRISVLLLIGAAGHEELALGAFHSKLGWLLFLVLAFAIMGAAERTGWFHREPEPERAQGLPEDAAPQVAPLFAALATALLTSLWAEPGLDRWYFLRIAVAVAVLARVRRGLPAPSLDLRGIPVAIGAVIGAAWILWGGVAQPELAGALAGSGPAERGLWLAGRAVGSILVIPLIEELAFRGFLLPWLAQRDTAPLRRFPWVAVLLSSAAFGVLHESWWLGTAAGIGFAAARLRRGRLSDAVLAHAVANAAVAAAAILGGRLDLWG